FSSAGSNSCVGWGSWDLDITADALAAEKKMDEIIMVAVDNSRSRYREYRGPVAASAVSQPGKSGRRSKPLAQDSAFENYASFLVNELKPWMDREYRTFRGPAHTAVMGSSLGGICSIALAWT